MPFTSVLVRVYSVKNFQDLDYLTLPLYGKPLQARGNVPHFTGQRFQLSIRCAVEVEQVLHFHSQPGSDPFPASPIESSIAPASNSHELMADLSGSISAGRD